MKFRSGRIAMAASGAMDYDRSLWRDGLEDSSLGCSGQFKKCRYVYVHIYMRMCMCIDIYTYIHIHIYIYVCMLIHIYIYI